MYTWLTPYYYSSVTVLGLFSPMIEYYGFVLKDVSETKKPGRNPAFESVSSCFILQSLLRLNRPRPRHQFLDAQLAQQWPFAPYHLHADHT